MRKSAQYNNNGLKTFFIYGGIVLFFIFISLLIKTIFVIQDSRFDGKHQFVLAIYKNDKLEEIIKFNPYSSEIFVAQPADNKRGIISDAKVNSVNELPLGQNVAETMKQIGFRYNSLETNLTIFDIVRLIIASYKSPVKLFNDTSMNNFFVDEAISSENIDTQIINASGVSGKGKDLEDVLKKLGYNVVAVTTSRSEEKLSKIQHFDEQTYATKKLEKILDFPLEETSDKGIADIVITIGEDSKNSTSF